MAWFLQRFILIVQVRSYFVTIAIIAIIQWLLSTIDADHVLFNVVSVDILAELQDELL